MWGKTQPKNPKELQMYEAKGFQLLLLTNFNTIKGTAIWK